MSNYRRLISYIYAYEGGVKGKNIGFAKLEARNGQCKISVNVKKVYVGGNDLGVYLLSGKEEILLGKIFIRNGAGEFRTAVNVNNVDGRDCTLDQCYGLTVHDLESSWQSYTTIWEDAVAHAAEVELADVTAEKRLEKELAGNQARIIEQKQPVYIRSVVEEIEAEIQAEVSQETAEELYPYENRKTGMIQPDAFQTAVHEPENEILESGKQDLCSGEEKYSGKECTEFDLFQPEEEFTNPSNTADIFRMEERNPHQSYTDDSISGLESIHPDQSDFMPYITAPYYVPQNLQNLQKPPEHAPDYDTGLQSSVPGSINSAIPQYTVQQADSFTAQPWEGQMKTDNLAESYSSKISQFAAYRATSDKSEQSFKSQPEHMNTESNKTISEAVKTVLEPLFSNTSNKAENHAAPPPSTMQKGHAIPQEVNAREPVSFQDEELKIKPKIINPEPSEQKPLLGNPEELERLQKAEQEENNHQQIWRQFSKRYPKIQAFDYDNGCEILTIKPQDIGLLPRETWVFGNNSFLLHGYYNYRYLILAKLENPQGQPRYLLGVPGHYYSNEKYMASMFGFPNFVLSKNQPTEDGRFGYWYTDVRLSSQ